MGRRDGKNFQRNHRTHSQYHNSKNAPRAARPNAVHSSLKESEIGITEYVTTATGFTGIIKQRISDFHVNEIGFDGKICKLLDFSVPKPPADAAEELVNSDDFIKLITQEKFDEISAIEKDENKDDDNVVLIDVTSMEKIERTQIHHTIKQVFNRITSSTVDVGEKKFIKCLKQNKKHDRRSKWVWPNEYTYFLLYKENVDTMQAVSSMAPLLNGARASAITYAGTKDKRAKTTQWACIRRREPSVIVRAAQRLRNINVGNFLFRDQPLKLGQLQGNRFRIALRQITAKEDDIEKSLQTFKTNGFINYYGHQRFGNHSSVPTHQVGLSLVRGDFKQACELILKPRENDLPEMQIVREHWWEKRDAVEALKLLERNGYGFGGRGIEHKLLAGLAKNGPNDFVNSLENIPRNVRLMYIHSYQSLIWNEIASRRIAKFGLALCEGDLVRVDTEANTEIIDDEIDNDDLDTDETNTEVDDNADQPMSQSRFQAMVKPLTKSDIELNKYTVFDVVLPLPGHDITYPANECSQWYEERLQQDGLSSEKLKQKQKTYSLTGAYRRMLIQPQELNWHFMQYHSETDTLIRSDIEELRGASEPKSIEDGAQKALVLEFSLPSSTYATMALREILKSDTSVANQIKLQTTNDAKRYAEANEDDEASVEAKKAKIDDDNDE